MRNMQFCICLLCLVLPVYTRAYTPQYDQNGRLTILRADLNRDGYFNTLDIDLFASAWLQQDCGLNNPCNCADNFPDGGDGVIDFLDFAVSADAHGLCTDPENPNCLHVPLTLFEPPSDREKASALGWLLHMVGDTHAHGLANLHAPGMWMSSGRYHEGSGWSHSPAEHDESAFNSWMPPQGGGGSNPYRCNWVGSVFLEHESPLDGGYMSRVRRDSIQGGYIGAHEVGHSFLSFVDEYVEGGFENMSITHLGAFAQWHGGGTTHTNSILPGAHATGMAGIVGAELDNGQFTTGVYPAGFYGTSAAQGARPLVPSLPGGGSHGGDPWEWIFFTNANFAYPGGDFGDQLLINQMVEMGDNQGAMPVLPSLPGGVEFSCTVLPSATPHANSVMAPYEGVSGNWGAGTGYGSTCVFSGICGKQGAAGWDTGWTDPSGGREGSFSTYGNQRAKPFLPGGGGGQSGDSFGTVDYLDMNADGFPDLINGKGSASKLHLFSGEVCESAVDLHIPGRGPDFVWGRTYRSRMGPNTVMGNGWDFSYNIYLTQSSGNLILHNGGTCRRDIYYPQPNGTWVADGFPVELAQDDDVSFVLTFPHKGTWKFHSLDEPNAPGKLNTITDRNGNALTFDYDSSGRLTTVHDTLDNPEYSREITIAYDTDGRIDSVTDWTGRQVTYEHYASTDPNGCAGDLKSATSPAVTRTPTGNDFPDGKTTTYTYSRGFADDRLNHNLLSVIGPAGQTRVYNVYGNNPNDPNFDHVTQQTWGDSNNVLNFTFLQQTPDANNNYAVTRIVINDFVGNVTERFYDNLNRCVISRRYTGRADPNLPTTIDPNINLPTGKLRPDDPPFFETRFQYNDDFLPTRIDYPNGNYRTIVYESDLDPNASVPSRGNLCQMHSFPGSLEPLSDQNEIAISFEYDPNINHGTNLPTRYVDPCGYETLYDYDPNGNCTRTTHVIPGSEPNIVYDFQYNQFGQLTAHILPGDASGYRRRDTLAYNTNPGEPNYGQLRNSIVDANNLALTTAFQFNEVGNLTLLTDPRGNDTQYVVNELNQLIRRTSRQVADTNSFRIQTDIYFDVNDNIERIDVQNRDDLGNILPNAFLTTTCEHDILNRLTAVEAEVDATKTVRTEFEYDRNHNLTLVRSGQAVNTSEPNNVVRFLYDERNLLFQIIRAEGEPNQSITQYDYDGNANLKKVSQGLGSPPRISNFQYDGFNRLVEVNDPMGNITDYCYDALGNLLQRLKSGEPIDSPGGDDNSGFSESSYEYDGMNRLILSEVSFFDPNTQVPIGDGNLVTQFYYNDNSKLTSLRDDNGNWTYFDYDTAGRLSLVADAKGNTTAYSYDDNSNITAVTEIEKSDLGNPNETFVTAYQYDNLDRLTMVTDNNDSSTHFAYDSRGNCTQTTDARGNQTRYEYDGLNRPLQTIRDMDGDGADPSDANDIVTSLSWDDNSRLASNTDDNGNTTTYGYDPLNRLTKITYADETENQFVYDVHHNIIQTTDAAGTVVSSTYDLLNRLTARTITPGSGVSGDTTFENYKYDSLSRLVYAQDDDSLVTLSYDSLSNLISETLNTQTTTFVHDGLGNRLSCTYPSGRVITSTFDELNRVENISDGPNSIAVYDYMGPARIERLSFGNNTQCDYSYDNLKRITATTHVFDPCGANTVIDSRTYQWDDTHNMTQRKDTRSGGPQLTHDYTYDAANRLVHTTVTDSFSAVVRDTAYSLDGVGNRTNVTGSPDPGTYTMDSNTPEPADAQMNQYTTTPFDSRQYDKNGNLTTIDSGEPNQKDIIYDYRNQMVEVNDTSTGRIHTYAYDALGRRIKRIVDANAAPLTTLYFYEGPQVIEEQDANNSTQATSVYGNYMCLGISSDGNEYSCHTDGFFSTMAVTDVNGLVVERYEYGDYGEPNFYNPAGTPISSSAIDNTYLFMGRRYDPETGLYYHHTGYLDPRAARFTSR